MVIDFALNPGGAPRFRELTEKVAEATAAVTPEAYFVSMMPGVGASGPRTILILPSLAGQDNPPPGPAQRVMQHFGQEEGSRIVSMNDSVANLSYTLFRTRPDLSYTSAD